MRSAVRCEPTSSGCGWAKMVLPSPATCSLRATGRLPRRLLALSQAWALVKRIEHPLSGAVPHDTQKRLNFMNKAARTRRRMVGERESSGGQGSGGLVLGRTCLLNPKHPPPTRSDCLRTEMTSRDEVERVQLSYTQGSEAGVSPKPLGPRIPSPAPAWVEMVAEAARLS